MSKRSKPIVAVVGRPNVGKSTLFNTLAGSKISIVKDTPGITRDRIYADVTWLNKNFTLIDTGGIEPDSKDVILSQMREQAQIAIDTADVIIFMVDVHQGLVDADSKVADMLRRAQKPVVLVVNKVDNYDKYMADVYEFYNLGIGDPHAVSAANQLGIGDMLDVVTGYFEEGQGEEEEDNKTRVAIVGKPNVGKSSLINRLIGENRLIVSDIAGTTRDAFGSSHRAHASVAGVTDFVRAKGGNCAVGYLMQKEINFLGNAVENPVRPFVAILGGAKVADKLNVINNLLEKCDTLIIGGGMAFTFLKAKGYEIGKSLVDDEKIDYCKEMMAKAEKLGKKLLLPIDTTVAAEFPNPIDAQIEVQVVDADKIPADMEGLDIGTKTAELYADAVKSAKTVVWNGPMGVFENPILAKGTIAVAKSLAETNATTIIGGGDSAAAVNQLGFADKMSHISTGGGASLEFLEGKVLPGVAAADDK